MLSVRPMFSEEEATLLIELIEIRMNFDKKQIHRILDQNGSPEALKYKEKEMNRLESMFQKISYFFDEE